jgi:hypothetical protein
MSTLVVVEARFVSQPNASFETLLLHLKENRGFDFTGYKRSSLTRRVERRMAQVGVGDYAEYLDYLEVHTEEFTALFNTILINMTSFFRDREAWEYLRVDILPRMLAGRAHNGVFRVWSAGCASGEEAYTLAIILAEALGVEEFRQRVKIYATDVDEEGHVHARQEKPKCCCRTPNCFSRLTSNAGSSARSRWTARCWRTLHYRSSDRHWAARSCCATPPS